MAGSFPELQRTLGPILRANRPGSTEPHVVVGLPSFSIGDSLLEHYADRLPALEHRYLLASLMLPRIPGCELVVVGSEAPSPEVVEYHLDLMPAASRDSVRARLHPFEVPDTSNRSVAVKLLERPDLIEELKDLIAGRPAFIEPWNVTDAEVEVALALDAPINGTDPALWHIGFKSAGRKLFAAAGVPVPVGREDVRTTDDVIEAVHVICAARPGVDAVIVKHDNSGAGDGNVVLSVDRSGPDLDAVVRAAVESLPQWYLDDLAEGGIVEERIAGVRFTSPSVQVDVDPDGDVVVLSTHEQVLSGEHGQVYSGCRFPADPAYAAELARHGVAIGRALAALGGMGRMAIDFAAALDEDGRWSVHALEVNLRKGGTSHPFTTLRHLVPGRYDAEEGRWCSEEDDSPRWYQSTDNLLDPAWTVLTPGQVVDAIRDAGLAFDPSRGCGVVLHMLAGLHVDGRFGLTAIGRTEIEAEALYDGAVAAVSALVEPRDAAGAEA
jgi:hypothetical protein